MLLSLRRSSLHHKSPSRRCHPLLLVLSLSITVFVIFFHPSSRRNLRTYYTNHARPLISSLSLTSSSSSSSSLSSSIRDKFLLSTSTSAHSTIPENAAISGPANSTLGFGAVAVVSGSTTSERMRRLIQAANVTGLELSVPKQPVRTDEDVQQFLNGGLVDEGDGSGGRVEGVVGQKKDDKAGKPMGKGSIMAWLGHLDVLEWFLKTDHETILILEDDVDWDIRLRLQQVPLAAAATRSIFMGPSNTSQSRKDQDYYTTSSYWGDTTAWDLLYLGHCGDYFTSPNPDSIIHEAQPSSLNSIPHVTYSDVTVPKRPNLHPLTATFMANLGLPERTRLVHQSVFPLCTFGYAVTRAAARKILEDVAPPRAPPPSEARAFDVAILRACRQGRSVATTKINNSNNNNNDSSSTGDRSLRCLTVNPELMHHRPGDSLIADVDTHAKQVHRPPVDVAADEVIHRTGETANIECGFWSGDFDWEEEGIAVGAGVAGNGNDNSDGEDEVTDRDHMETEKERFTFLREEVGEKGRCLKRGREIV